MEGRLSPRQDDNNQVALAFPIAPSPHETYIVQYPKDQVYRVPPPENALIVESYRNPNNPKTKGKNISVFSCLLTLFLVLLAIVFLLALIIAILYFVYAPTAPAFSIADVAVKNNLSGQKQSRPQYQISLTVNNPNGNLGLKYHNDSVVLLLYEGKNVAKGKFPSLEQEPNNSTKTKVELAGSNNGPLPKKIEQSMNDSNVPISMDMEAKLSVRMNSGWFKTWLWHCNVGCGFKVSTLRSNGRVISQECHAELNPWS